MPVVMTAVTDQSLSGRRVQVGANCINGMRTLLVWAETHLDLIQVSNVTTLIAKVSIA